jgi:Aspartyl protease
MAPDGPVVVAIVGVSAPRMDALTKANQPVPTAQQVRALIDTGAGGTAVDSSIIQALQLVATGTVPIRTPSTGAQPHQCNQYDVGIALPMRHGLHMMNLVIPVIEANLAAQGIHVLLGRDVLANCVLTYNGLEDYFVIGV